MVARLHSTDSDDQRDRRLVMQKVTTTSANVNASTEVGLGPLPADLGNASFENAAGRGYQQALA